MDIEDQTVKSCIIHLNMVTAKLLGRIAALQHVKNNKEYLRDDLDRFTRAKDHVEAALSYIDQAHFRPPVVPLELPF